MLGVNDQLNEDMQRVAGKVDRALERMRKAAMRVLDGGTSNSGVPDDRRDAARLVAEAFVDVSECILSTVCAFMHHIVELNAHF